MEIKFKENKIYNLQLSKIQTPHEKQNIKTINDKFSRNNSYLVDPASSDTLPSKIKPCMSQYSLDKRERKLKRTLKRESKERETTSREAEIITKWRCIYVEECDDSVEVLSVSSNGTVVSTDLGGSSKQTSDNLVDRRG
ncbi:hypothetical protein RND71_044159 [Anisodus tanguticus]|uniref:Uncharacterized protein n=1 Tax=Anisodus tanguticus TaxID=243964 RepID=A0AAE1URM1_9SOLA|nr:hypothetical protein RND71_044159 [Anisodus tanguticus]